MNWKSVITLTLVTACAGESSSVVWQHQTPRPVLAGDSEMREPQITGDLIVFCGGYGWDRKGVLAALEHEDGERRWEHNVGWCYADPMIVDSTAVAFGSQPDHMVLKAVDIPSGRLLWEHKLSRQTTPPIAHGGKVFLAVIDTLYRIDARAGVLDRTLLPACGAQPNQRIWLTSTPGRALLGCGPLVLSLNAIGDAVAPLITLSLPADRPEFITLDGQRLYVLNAGIPATDQLGRLAVFDLADGRLIWKREWRKVLSNVRVTANELYLNVSAPEWALLSLDPATGEERWRSPIRSFQPPVPVGNKLYGNDRSTVVTLDPQTGSILSRFRSSGEVSTTPVLLDNRLFFGNLKGVLYSIRADF